MTAKDKLMVESLHKRGKEESEMVRAAIERGDSTKARLLLSLRALTLLEILTYFQGDPSTEKTK